MFEFKIMKTVVIYGEYMSELYRFICIKHRIKRGYIACFNVKLLNNGKIRQKIIYENG